MTWKPNVKEYGDILITGNKTLVYYLDWHSNNNSTIFNKCHSNFTEKKSVGQVLDTLRLD